MRALGAGRRQVIGSVLLEAVVIGVVASVLGLAAGIGVGALLAPLFTSSHEPAAGRRSGVPVTAVIVGVRDRAAGHRGGRGAAGAARVPDPSGGGDAGRGHPGPAADPADRRRRRRRRRRRGALGLSGLAGSTGDTLWRSWAGCWSRSSASPCSPRWSPGRWPCRSGRLFSWSVPGSLGRLNAGRNPRRTAITAAALMVGIALVSGINVIMQSAKASLDDAVRRGRRTSDLIVLGDMSGATLPTFDAARSSGRPTLPGVVATTGLYQDAARWSMGSGPSSAATSDFIGVGRGSSGRPWSRGTRRGLAGRPVWRSPTTSRSGTHLAIGRSGDRPVESGASRTHADGGGRLRRRLVIGGYVLPARARPRTSTAAARTWGRCSRPHGRRWSRCGRRWRPWLGRQPEVTVTDRAVHRPTDRVDRPGAADGPAAAGPGDPHRGPRRSSTRWRCRCWSGPASSGCCGRSGLSRAAITRMVTVESVVISVFGALLGIAVGVALGAAAVNALAEEGHEQLALPWASFGIYLGYRPRSGWWRRFCRRSGPPGPTCCRRSPTSERYSGDGGGAATGAAAPPPTTQNGSPHIRQRPCSSRRWKVTARSPAVVVSWAVPYRWPRRRPAPR